MNSTFKTNKEKILFNDTNEYWEVFQGSFLKSLALMIQQKYKASVNDGTTLNDLIEGNKEFSMSLSFMIRFTIKLLEEGTLDPSTFTPDEINAIGNIELSDQFLQRIYSLSSLNINKLLDHIQVDEKFVQMNNVREEIKFSLAVTMAAMMTKLDVEDDVSIDSLLSGSKELKQSLFEIYVVSKFLGYNQNISTEELQPMTILKNYKETDEDRLEFENIMFDMGSLTKKELYDISSHIF